ncbi:MAG: Arm DNA-binding domain-containing protein [Janthinobacterium lividum]
MYQRYYPNSYLLLLATLFLLCPPIEVTYQLCLSQLTKSGQAQLQLTYCWDGQHLRVGIGEKCLPKHWDTRRQRVKDKPNAYATDINQVLDDYAAASLATYRAAQDAPLNKDHLRTGIAQHLAALLAERTGQAVLPLPPKVVVLTFLDYFDQ